MNKENCALKLVDEIILYDICALRCLRIPFKTVKTADLFTNKVEKENK